MIKVRVRITRQMKDENGNFGVDTSIKKSRGYSRRNEYRDSDKR